MAFLRSLFVDDSQYDKMRKEQLENLRFAQGALDPELLTRETRDIFGGLGGEQALAYEQMGIESESRGVAANMRQLLGADAGSALGAIYGAAIRGAGRVQGNNLRRAAMMDIFDRVLQKQGIIASGYAGLPTIERSTSTGFGEMLQLGGSVMEAFGGNPWKTPTDTVQNNVQKPREYDNTASWG